MALPVFLLFCVWRWSPIKCMSFLHHWLYYCQHAFGAIIHEAKAFIQNIHLQLFVSKISFDSSKGTSHWKVSLCRLGGTFAFLVGFTWKIFCSSLYLKMTTKIQVFCQYMSQIAEIIKDLIARIEFELTEGSEQKVVVSLSQKSKRDSISSKLLQWSPEVKKQ